MKQKTTIEAYKIVVEHYPLAFIYDIEDLRSVFNEKSRLRLTDKELQHYSQRFFYEGIGGLLLEDELVEFAEKHHKE